MNSSISPSVSQSRFRQYSPMTLTLVVVVLLAVARVGVLSSIASEVRVARNFYRN